MSHRPRSRLPPSARSLQKSHTHRRSSVRSCMGKLKVSGKPFDISKREVWEAYEKVKANKGAAGVDGQSVEEFEADLQNNLYKIWSASSQAGGKAVIRCS